MTASINGKQKRVRARRRSAACRSRNSSFDTRIRSGGTRTEGAAISVDFRLILLSVSRAFC